MLFALVAISVAGVLVARHPVGEAVYWMLWAPIFARSGWVFWKAGFRLPALADAWMAAVGIGLSLAAASGRTFDRTLGDQPLFAIGLAVVPLAMIWIHSRQDPSGFRAWREAATRASVGQFLLASYVPKGESDLGGD